MIDIYLKKVHHNNGFDVMAYKEKECIKPVAHWRWWQIGRPDRRNRKIMFNCYWWRAVWLTT